MTGIELPDDWWTAIDVCGAELAEVGVALLEGGCIEGEK